MAAYHFKYYRGFADVRLSLELPVTLLIGRNGAGKSNLLEGIHLLAELVRGCPFYEVSPPGRGGGCEVRGGLGGCPSLGEPFFVIGVDDAADGGRLAYEIAIRPDVGQIESEALVWNDVPLFRSVSSLANFRRRVVPVQYHPQPPEPWPRSPPSEPLAADRLVLYSYPNFIERPATPQARSIIEQVQRFKERLAACLVVSPRPELMRMPARLGQALGFGHRPLTSGGANLSAVLYELAHGGEEDRHTLERIVTQVRALPEEPFGEIDFIQSPLGEVMLAFKRPNDQRLDAQLLSDGTLRYLAILTALETAAPGSLLLIEDLDAGLHPSRVGELLKSLWVRCKERGLRALLTTHNPVLLDALGHEQLAGVVVCYQDQVRATAALCPLLQIADADLMLERGQLGDLLTRQVIEQHLAPDLLQRRQALVKSWLGELP